MNWKKIKKEYIDLIEEDFWPFWEKHIDREFGGVLNCISNDGKRQISDQKFTWSQGRFLWLLGALLELSSKGILTRIDSNEIEKLLQQCKEFVLDHCLTEEYHVYYLTDRQGNPLPESRTGKLEASIFSDCFIIIGLANALRTTNNTQGLLELSRLYRSVVKRISNRTFMSEPYPIPSEYQSHSIPMILLNTSIEYGQCLEAIKNEGIEIEDFSISEEMNYAHDVEKRCSEKIRSEFYDPRTGLMREYISTEENYNTRLVDRHCNPGHTIECSWFLIEHYQRTNELEKHIDWIEELAIASYKIGWDKEFGGLLRFVDREGGMPRGERTNDRFEENIISSSTMKLWWPHSETLYAFLLLYSLSNNEESKAIYDESAKYIFATFPDPELGEWIQIRDRYGNPEEKEVALPVKDPFHILRNFIKIIILAEAQSNLGDS